MVTKKDLQNLNIFEIKKVGIYISVYFNNQVIGIARNRAERKKLIKDYVKRNQIKNYIIQD